MNALTMCDVLFVDRGWRKPDFDCIDIATFGVSRVNGQALIELIGRESCGLG